jgi:hypothetical protein
MQKIATAGVLGGGQVQFGVVVGNSGDHPMKVVYCILILSGVTVCDTELHGCRGSYIGVVTSYINHFVSLHL